MRSLRKPLLVLTVSLALAGCSFGTPAAPPTTTQQQTPPTPTPPDQTPTPPTETGTPYPTPSDPGNESPSVPTETVTVSQEPAPGNEEPPAPPTSGDPTDTTGGEGQLQSRNLANSGITPGQQVDAAAVTNYVTAVITDADKVWTSWMTGVGYPEPYVEYHLIQPGTTETFNTACASKDRRHPDAPATATFDSDFPNAFYCNVPNEHNEDGIIILPVESLAGAWSGDIIGVGKSTVVGDFAAATIVSHEFGHHVVSEMAKDTGQPEPTGANVELIADCFAGVWTTALYSEGRLEQGDLDEALAALASIGDDPRYTHSQPHGTAEERQNAFKVGIYGLTSDPRGGVPANCINNYWSGFTGPR